MPKLPNPPDTMQLRYSQLEQLVGNLLDAHPDRKSPLSARFRLFRQRGFPPNVTTLAKTRFAYDIEAVLQVALAFWMMNAFVPQEVMPVAIEANWPALKEGFRKSFALISAGDAAEAAVDEDRMVLLVLPNNLQAFKLEKDIKADPAKSVTLKVMTARQARERMFGEKHYTEFEPITFIDLHRLANWIRDAVVKARWYGPEPFETFARGG